MIFRRAWRFCGWCTIQGARLALWGSWLLLLLALAGQIHLLSSRRVPVPEPLRRLVEQRLAEKGLRFDYDHARMDFAGRFVFENLAVGPTSDAALQFAIARTAYVRFDPWQLLVGRVQPRDVRLDNLEIPRLASRIDLAFALDGRVIDLSYLSGYIGSLPVVAGGRLRIPDLPPPSDPDEPPGEHLADDWSGHVARLRAVETWLAAAQNPALRLRFHDRDVEVSVRADSIDLGAIPGAPAVKIDGLRARTTIAISASPAIGIVSGEIDAASFPPDISAQELVFSLDASAGLAQAAADLQLGALRARGIDAGPLVATLRRTAPRGLDADLSARLAGGVWRARASIGENASRVTLDGVVGDATLAFAGGLIQRDLSALLDPEQDAHLHVNARFAPGFRVEKVSGLLHSGSVRVGDVMLDETGTEFTYDGERVLCDALVLRQGESIAHGSYEMDTRTMDFRFLLSGGLRPLGISGWFHEWWTNFWNDFDFSRTIPDADVDVQGRWGDLTQTRVFVRADGGPAGIKGVDFDRVSTRLFLRPHWFDIRHFSVARPDGGARGSLSRSLVPDTDDWTSMEFSVASTLPLPVIAQLFPDESDELLAPYAFTTPPALQIDGRVDSAASASGKHEYIDVGLRSAGPMTFHGFPLADLEFLARIRDDRIDLPALSVAFAKGRAQGDARLWGAPDQRRLAFDITLSEASLGTVIQAVSQLQPAPAPASPKAAEAARLRLQRLESGRLDFTLKAEGLYSDFHSFKGSGRADITHAELGQLNLFGPLSAALRGTLINLGSFSLTTVEAPFVLKGDRVHFDDLRVTGPSALLIAKGDYGLRGGHLDFVTRIHPFDENESLIGSAVSLFLTPFSKVFEVRLAGTLSEPSWIFSYGPSRLLNTLTGAGSSIPPAEGKPSTPSP